MRQQRQERADRERPERLRTEEAGFDALAPQLLHGALAIRAGVLHATSTTSASSHWKRSARASARIALVLVVQVDVVRLEIGLAEEDRRDQVAGGVPRRPRRPMPEGPA